MEIDVSIIMNARKWKVQGAFPPGDICLVGTSGEIAYYAEIVEFIYDEGQFITYKKNGKRLDRFEAIQTMYQTDFWERGLYISGSGQHMPFIEVTGTQNVGAVQPTVPYYCSTYNKLFCHFSYVINNIRS